MSRMAYIKLVHGENGRKRTKKKRKVMKREEEEKMKIKKTG